MATIESQDLSIGKLFNDFYIVPSYQREYVWGKDEVTEFFEDIYHEFSSDTPKKQYFIGSIIVCEKEHGIYELIDGQQRITTAYLLLCAIRESLKSKNEFISKLNRQIASIDIDENGKDIFRYRVDLQYEDSCGVLKYIAQPEQEDLSDPPNTLSANNLYGAYETLKDLIGENFGQTSPRIEEIRKFYADFQNNVTLVRVKTQSQADALRIFATINNRGVALKPIDLVKNLMFMETSKENYNLLKIRWKAMVDNLYEAKEDPIRFLRYFILSSYEENLEFFKGDIYKWLLDKSNKLNYQQDPIQFVDNLLSASRSYTKYVKGKDTKNNTNRYLMNIKKISGNAKMPFMVLLAGRDLTNDCFTELCKQIENIFFVYLLLREHPGSFEPKFINWCSAIRQIKKSKTKFRQFISEYINPEKKRLSKRFEATFSQLDESSIAKPKLKYILAKLTQYVDELAYGSTDAIIELKNYMGTKIQIEHILPKTETLDIKQSFDKPEEIEAFVKKLGNLTLLEKPINTSIKNQNFFHKKNVYPESRYLLTRAIATPVNVGKNTSINRATANLHPFDEWTSESIEQRQKMLTELAKKVWEMP